MSIFDIWEKLPTHARIIFAVAILIVTITKPTLLIIKWFRDKRKTPIQNNNGEISVPFSIKLLPQKKKNWYKDKLNNHNIFFQFNELIKYEIDSNNFVFGSSEKTRIFRQILRIYLSVLSDNILLFFNGKVDLDHLKDKEFSEHFDNFIENVNYISRKKFKENLTPSVHDLLILHETNGFDRFIEKHKKNFIRSVKEMINQDKKMYDNTNYRKMWEILSLLRLIMSVALEDYKEFYSNGFNGDLDDAMKKN